MFPYFFAFLQQTGDTFLSPRRLLLCHQDAFYQLISFQIKPHSQDMVFQNIDAKCLSVRLVPAM